MNINFFPIDGSAQNCKWDFYVAILSSVKIGQVCDMHGKAERCVSTSVFSRDTLCIVASG